MQNLQGLKAKAPAVDRSTFDCLPCRRSEGGQPGISYSVPWIGPRLRGGQGVLAWSFEGVCFWYSSDPVARRWRGEPPPRTGWCATWAAAPQWKSIRLHQSVSCGGRAPLQRGARSGPRPLRMEARAWQSHAGSSAPTSYWRRGEGLDCGAPKAAHEGQFAAPNASSMITTRPSWLD
jgi:hypothetical protein